MSQDQVTALDFCLPPRSHPMAWRFLPRDPRCELGGNTRKANHFTKSHHDMSSITIAPWGYEHAKIEKRVKNGLHGLLNSNNEQETCSISSGSTASLAKCNLGGNKFFVERWDSLFALGKESPVDQRCPIFGSKYSFFYFCFSCCKREVMMFIVYTLLFFFASLIVNDVL